MAFTPDAALRYLGRAHKQDRLAHAYLITGAQGSGKRKVASALANLVNGTDLEDIFASSPTGVFVAEPESKSRRIVIDQIRALEHSLQMRASDGRRKVAIIVDADRLHPQAANAFLKTLEEPPNDSLLLLLTAMPEVLPDTVISRCIPLSLAAQEKIAPTVEEVELTELLSKAASPSGQGVQRAYQLARGFHQLLNRIRETVQTENAAALKQDELRYKNTTDGAWLDDREDYYKALTESQYVQRRARLLETLFSWWSDILRANANIPRRDLPAARRETETLANKFTVLEILQRIRRLEDLRDHLGRNIQEALAIEVAFLSVFTF